MTFPYKVKNDDFDLLIEIININGLRVFTLTHALISNLN